MRKNPALIEVKKILPDGGAMNIFPRAIGSGCPEDTRAPEKCSWRDSRFGGIFDRKFPYLYSKVKKSQKKVKKSEKNGLTFINYVIYFSKSHK